MTQADEYIYKILNISFYIKRLESELLGHVFIMDNAKVMKTLHHLWGSLIEKTSASKKIKRMVEM